jgi:hypothetical protein
MFFIWSWMSSFFVWSAKCCMYFCLSFLFFQFVDKKKGITCWLWCWIPSIRICSCEIVATAIVEYDKQLSLPLLLEAYKLLMLNRVQDLEKSTYFMNFQDLFQQFDTNADIQKHCKKRTWIISSLSYWFGNL